MEDRAVVVVAGRVGDHLDRALAEDVAALLAGLAGRPPAGHEGAPPRCPDGLLPGPGDLDRPLVGARVEDHEDDVPGGGVRVPQRHAVAVDEPVVVGERVDPAAVRREPRPPGDDIEVPGGLEVPVEAERHAVGGGDDDLRGDEAAAAVVHVDRPVADRDLPRPAPDPRLAAAGDPAHRRGRCRQRSGARLRGRKLRRGGEVDARGHLDSLARRCGCRHGRERREREQRKEATGPHAGDAIRPPGDRPAVGRPR